MSDQIRTIQHFRSLNVLMVIFLLVRTLESGFQTDITISVETNKELVRLCFLNVRNHANDYGAKCCNALRMVTDIPFYYV